MAKQIKTGLKMKGLVALLGGILLSLSLTATPPAARWSGEKKSMLWSYWSFELNGGFTSYFGDLSQYDSDVWKKISHESSPAFSLLATKHFGSTFGLSGQVLYGGFGNAPGQDYSFTTRLLEYNFQASVNLVSLFSHQSKRRFGLSLFAGAGQFLFRVAENRQVGGETRESVHDTRVPEFVMLAGGSMHYHLSRRFSVTMNLALRQAQNDRLDNQARNADFDYYTYFSIGLTYNVCSLLGPSKRSNLVNTEFPYGYR